MPARLASLPRGRWPRRPLARLAAALGASLALAANAWSLTLLEAYQAALGSDPQFAAARANYTAGMEQLPQARAQLLPWVSASAEASYTDTRTRFSNELPRRRAYTDAYGYGLVLSQPLFDWTSWQSYEAARLAVTATEVQLQQAYQDLLLRVAQAYFDVLVAEDALVALEAERQAIAEQLEWAQRNFELGTATITDTYEAQARFDLIEAQVLQADNQIQVRRDALAKIIGRPPTSLAALPPGTPAPGPQPARVDAWIERAETDNLTVVQSQIATAIAGRQIEIARGGHYPQVGLVGSLSHSDSPYRPEASMTGVSEGRARGRSASVGIQIDIPIYTGGYVSSRVTETVALEQRARHDYENARREAVRATREAFLGVNTGLAQIRALEAGEQSSRKALEANQTGYEVGVRINLDVLNAQQQLYATQRDLAAARYNTVMAGLRLKAAAGQLTEDDIEGVNRLLRPR